MSKRDNLRNKFGFLAYAKRTPSQAPSVDERFRNHLPYVYYDSDNLFPQRLINLADNSAIHSSILNEVARYTGGDGFEFIGDSAERAEEYLNEILGELSIKEFITKTSVDIAYFQGFSWQVGYGRGSLRGEIVRLWHSDFSTVRSGKMEIDDRGKGIVNDFWLSADWRVATGKRAFGGRDEFAKPHFVSAFNPKQGSKDGLQMIYCKWYKPSKRFYPEPKYIGALHWVDLSHSIAEWKNNTLKNGFSASVHLHVPTVKEDDEAYDLRSIIEEDFAGSRNAGGIFLTTGGVDEPNPVLNAVPSNANAEIISEINSRVNENIVASHGMPPLLMGVQVATGLQSEGQAFQEAMDLFQNTKIRPNQALIEAKINKILEMAGIDAEFKIEKLAPVNFLPSDEIMLQTWTTNEIRERYNKEELEDGSGDIIIGQQDGRL